MKNTDVVPAFMEYIICQGKQTLNERLGEVIGMRNTLVKSPRYHENLIRMEFRKQNTGA